MINAILFDLDGVLVDACEWHYKSFNRALDKKCGFIIERDEHQEIFNGLPTTKKLSILETQNRISNDDFDEIWKLKQKYTFDIIDSHSQLDSDKIELHKFLIEKGIKIACVTNSITKSAKMMLEKTGQFQYMSFVISNNDVKNPKPHPEGYIRAMIRMGEMPDNVLIIEDSDKGIQAANQTGAHVLRVENAKIVTIHNIRKILENE
ncbi:HAD family hydrolase [archaeon]|nr:HAD family hydrolase [archaeon]